MKKELIVKENKEELSFGTRVKVKMKKEITTFASFVYTHKDVILTMLMITVIMTPKIVFAGTASTGGDDQWETIVDTITKWGKRIGGAIAFMGAIEFGIGWKEDRLDQRTNGLRAAVSGLIVLGVCATSSSWMK